MSDTIESLRARAEKAEAALLGVHDALHRECDEGTDLPTEIRALRARAEKAEAAVGKYHSAYFASREEFAAAQKRIEALEGALRWAVEFLYSYGEEKPEPGMVTFAVCNHCDAHAWWDSYAGRWICNGHEHLCAVALAEAALASPSESAPQPTPETRVDLGALEGALEWLRVVRDAFGNTHCDSCYAKFIDQDDVDEDCAPLHYAIGGVVRYLDAHPAAAPPSAPQEGLAALLGWLVENQEQAFDDSYDARRHDWPLGDNRADLLREWDRKIAQATALLGGKP